MCHRQQFSAVLKVCSFIRQSHLDRVLPFILSSSAKQMPEAGNGGEHNENNTNAGPGDQREGQPLAAASLHGGYCQDLQVKKGISGINIFTHAHTHTYTLTQTPSHVLNKYAYPCYYSNCIIFFFHSFVIECDFSSVFCADCR